MYIPSYQDKIDETIRVLKENPIVITNSDKDSRLDSTEDERSVLDRILTLGYYTEPVGKRTPEDVRLITNGTEIAVNIKVTEPNSQPNTIGSPATFAVALCGLDKLPTKMNANTMYEKIKGMYPTDEAAFWILHISKENSKDVSMYELGRLPEEAIYINSSNGFQINVGIASKAEMIDRTAEERAEFLIQLWIKYMRSKAKTYDKWL